MCALYGFLDVNHIIPHKALLRLVQALSNIQRTYSPNADYETLIELAAICGVAENEILNLLDLGYSNTEIEELLESPDLFREHVINIRGQTYRLKDRLKTGVQTVPPADIPAVG